MRATTARQLEILRFIELHSKRFGFAPSLREISAAFEISSLNGVADHIKGLRRHGLLAPATSLARSLVLTAAGHRALNTRPTASTIVDRVHEAISLQRKGLLTAEQSDALDKALTKILALSRGES